MTYSKKAFMDAVFDDPDLKTSEIAMLCALAQRYADWESGDRCYPSDDQLAAAIGSSRSTIIRARKVLEGRYFEATRDQRGYRYQLIIPDVSQCNITDSDVSQCNITTPSGCVTVQHQMLHDGTSDVSQCNINNPRTNQEQPKNDDDVRVREGDHEQAEDVVTEDELEEVPDEYLGLGYWQVKRSLDRALALDGQGPIERGAWDTQVAPKLGQLEEDQREDYVLWCAAKIQAKGLGRHILIRALASDHAEWRGVRFREEALKANPNAVYHPGSNRAMLARRDFETGELAKYLDVT